MYNLKIHFFQMKEQILVLLLLTTNTLFSQLYPVNERIIDASFINEKFKEVKVTSFAISNLITVQEFRKYLDAVQNDSSEIYFNSQLPTSSTFPKELVQIILEDSTLQKKPMPGVSWSVARNYCSWLNKKSTSKNLGFEYDLPYVSELIAYNDLYGTLNDSELESWSLNSYDESMLEFSHSINFCYSANDTDPPAMKRKVIYGGSYHMAYDRGNSFRKLQYEYQDSSSRYVGFRIVKRFNNKISNSISNDELNVRCTLTYNQFNGIYQENYANGRLKVLGALINGNRSGIWSIWNENGELKIQRNYTNNKVCDFVYPETNNPYRQIYSSFPIYKLQRNSDGFFPYLHIEERAVVFSQRVWRELSIKNENELFERIDMKRLVHSLFEKKSRWYHYGVNGDFKNEIPEDSVSNLFQSLDSWDLSRIEIKEDYFFNMDNLLSDTRQIGISFFKNESDDKPSYTIYYPWVRTILATFTFEYSGLNEIENLDDLFFFHGYRGNINHSSNINFEQKSDLEIQNEFTIELEKFVREHELWLMYGR